MVINVLIIGMGHNTGGVESYIMNIFRNVDRQQFHFIFTKEQETLAYEDEIVRLGGKIINNRPSRHHILQYLLFYRKLFCDNHINVVYYNTCDLTSIDVLMFGKKYGANTRIVHSHSANNFWIDSLYHKLLEKWCRANLHKYATHYLACGEQAGVRMFDKHPFTVIQNGISTGRFRYNTEKHTEIRNKLGIKDKFVIGFVGRLSFPKKPQFLVDVFSKFIRQQSEAVMLIIGLGELQQEIEAKIEQYGLQSKVKLLGGRSDIPDLMCAMDCFCLPSEFEGFPFVLVEAQANGLPCVVSKNISRECNLTGTMRFIGLDEPLENWVNALQNVTMPMPREQYADLIRDLGYDMETEVRKVEKIMIGEA